MALMINKNLVSISSMQFMNSSLEKLVKNLSDNNFKYLTQEFVSKNLELLKQRLYGQLWKVFRKKKFLIKNVFTDL